MGVTYLHLTVGQSPPPLPVAGPFRAVLVLDAVGDFEWRTRVSRWLLDAGCLYVISWGIECERWHDSVDWAHLDAFEFGEVPEDRSILTTCHEDEPLEEALWFAAQVAFHPTVALPELVLIDIGPKDRREEMLQTYAAAAQLVD